LLLFKNKHYLTGLGERCAVYPPPSETQVKPAQDKVFDYAKRRMSYAPTVVDGTLAHHCVCSIPQDDIAILILKALRELGARLNEEDHNNQTPYDVAIAQGRHNLAEHIKNLIDSS
jgi:hypothetical protein